MVEQLAVAGDVCAAVGGRVWRVVDVSAKTGDVAELKRVLRHLAELRGSLDPVRILAPRCQGTGVADATGASASLP